MPRFSKINLNRENFLSVLVALIPVSFIAGNMVININLIFLIIASLIFFRENLFSLKKFFLDKIIISFFLLILITGVINDYYFYKENLHWKGYFGTIIKSLFFLKYLFLYFVIRFLVEKNFLNLKLFFIFSSFSALFVSIDIFFQFINGKDVFGFVGQYRKLSGPFGDELIAGGFIQRFSLFAFFLFPIYFTKKNNFKINKYLIPILFIIFFIALILSGNRMPAIMFLFSILLVLIFQKQSRKYLIPFVIVFSVLFSVLLKSNENIKMNFKNFYFQVSTMAVLTMNKDFSSNNAPSYLKEFSSFYNTWLLNKYIGGGIKNFRYYCHVKPIVYSNNKFSCNMHPHNYYLEILTETGIVGFIIISIIFLNVLFLSLVKKYFLISTLKNNNIIIPFIFLFITEIFPFKSTGSFFTTGNATYIFLILGLIIGLVRRYNSIEKNI
jgi:O-antigen ligase